MYLTNFERDTLGFIGQPVVDAMDVAVAYREQCTREGFYFFDIAGFSARVKSESLEALAVLLGAALPPVVEVIEVAADAEIAVAVPFDDTPLVPDDPFGIEALQDKTKTELMEMAEGFYGKVLVMNMTKAEMIDELLLLAEKG